MLLRPGNAGSNTFADHKEVLSSALRQVPARLRRRLLIRVDGAGASHDLIGHLQGLSSPQWKVLFTCGWAITAADEAAIMALPENAWKPGIAQDGTVEQDKDVAEITGLPGSHHAQYIDVIHRDHATVETGGVRTAKAMGLRNLPSKSLQVNAGGSSPRTSPPTSPHGPASSATTTIPSSGAQSRTRSATASGTSPPGSPATPASASSPSAPAGPGQGRSSPAGTI